MAVLDWRELAKCSHEELDRLDLAEKNLACMVGLPGTDGLDYPGCLRRVGEMTDYAARYTDQAMPEFRHRPERYASEPYFRILCLVTALEHDLGVRYNPAKTDFTVPVDAVDTFVYGPVMGDGGICGSLAVLMTAVGRRLGYPLKLVPALGAGCKWEHLFFRWEDGTTTLNLEAQGNGLNSFPDDHYRTGKYEIAPEREEYGAYLRSMSPRAEVGGFLSERGHRWLDAGNTRRAAESFAYAFALYPEAGLLWNRLAKTYNDWHAGLEALKPPGFPRLQFTWPLREFPPGLPTTLEKDYLLLTATEAILREPDCERLWWGPLRAGRAVVSPTLANVVFRGRAFEIGYRFGT